MATANHKGDAPALYFDDLHVGQRFVSGTHQIDDQFGEIAQVLVATLIVPRRPVRDGNQHG
jgi:hypothetical protein